MQEIVIIGAGGFGPEVLQWVKDLNAAHPSFQVRGFLDSDEGKRGSTVHGIPVLGDLDWFDSNRDCGAIIAIGAPRHKLRISSRLRGLGIDFPRVIHPRAMIGDGVRIGAGAIICPDVILTTDIEIGELVTLNLDLTVGHGSRLESYCTLAPGIHISGNVTLREGCDIGTGVNVVPGVSIGPWSIVGAGATVSKSIPANVTAVGVPAKPIKTFDEGWHLR